MKKFMCLLLGNDSHMEMSPEEGQQVMQQWMAWYGRLKEAGSLVDMGGGFAPAGRRVSAENVTEGAGRHPDGSWVGGYLIIQAADLDAATEIAAGAPSFRGSAIELREMMGIPS